MNGSEYVKEYNALAAEFELAEVLINARETSGFSQQKIAKRMVRRSLHNGAIGNITR